MPQPFLVILWLQLEKAVFSEVPLPEKVHFGPEFGGRISLENPGFHLLFRWKAGKNHFFPIRLFKPCPPRKQVERFVGVVLQSSWLHALHPCIESWLNLHKFCSLADLEIEPKQHSKKIDFKKLCEMHSWCLKKSGKIEEKMRTLRMQDDGDISIAAHPTSLKSWSTLNGILVILHVRTCVDVHELFLNSKKCKDLSMDRRINLFSRKSNYSGKHDQDTVSIENTPEGCVRNSCSTSCNVGIEHPNLSRESFCRNISLMSCSFALILWSSLHYREQFFILDDQGVVFVKPRLQFSISSVCSAELGCTQECHLRSWLQKAGLFSFVCDVHRTQNVCQALWQLISSVESRVNLMKPDGEDSVQIDGCASFIMCMDGWTIGLNNRGTSAAVPSNKAHIGIFSEGMNVQAVYISTAGSMRLFALSLPTMLWMWIRQQGICCMGHSLFTLLHGCLFISIGNGLTKTGWDGCALIWGKKRLPCVLLVDSEVLYLQGHAVCQLCRAMENVTVFGTASYNKHEDIKNNLDHLYDHVVDYCQEVRK